jgi:MFS family permease
VNTTLPPGTWIESDVPPRLDALGWSRWHRRVIIALGITWILDGLEASLISNLGPTLQDRRTLGLSATQVGLANTVYLVGQVLGALVFGHLTDRLGRKKLFLVTLGLYLCATAASGFAPVLGVFLGFRFLAGAGIGGEYSAINSAIDELVPARLRGQIDLGINGSYWIGAMLGAILTLVVLDPNVVPVQIGWRLAFGLGAALGLAILFIRRDVPESPRWLLMHGYVDAARATIEKIERQVGHAPRAVEPVRLQVTGSVGFGELARTLALRFRGRAVLGFVLMFSQAFLYNALFFSIGLILHEFHHVPKNRVGEYMIPFAIGNFLGPLVLGPLFDRLGRRVMIPATYGLSAVLLVATGALFAAGALTAATQTIAWCLVFFVASAAGSAAYLTVSELFPVHLRGKAIAVFYAFGTLVGAGAPLLFGKLVAGGDRWQLFGGYLVVAGLLLFAAAIARWLGVDAERRSLESLTAH